MIPVEIQNAEIFDWWAAERIYVRPECDRQFHRLASLADEIIDDLLTKETLWVKSEARDDLK